MTPHDEQPPILGTWSRMYALVIVYLFALIGLFYWFTRSWNR
jgi:hypothetical protein